MKKSSIIIVIVFIVFFASFTCMSIFKPQQSFSENENRLLQSKPSFVWSDVISGKYGEDYENYLADQFVGRDLWIRIKTVMEQIRGMKEINGVYFTKDDYLIKKNESAAFETDQAKKNISYLNQFIESVESNSNIVSSNIMFVPTSETVLNAKLPPFVHVFDQYQWIENSVDDFVNLKETFDLKTHESDQIFYRTDHHWTTYGAYLAYTQWMNQIGMKPKNLTDYTIETVSDSFYGTLHSKINTQIQPDTIEAYKSKTLEDNSSIVADGQTISLYDESKLQTKDQYAYFLGGNYGQVIIENNNYSNTTRNLLIIKDSYANCFVPFAVEHFIKTIMVDLRHTNQSMVELIENENITDILVLYSTENFVEDRNIYKLNR